MSAFGAMPQINLRANRDLMGYTRLDFSSFLLKSLNVIGYETVLAVTVVAVSAPNVGVGKKMPDLMRRLELWKLRIQGLLDCISLLIPAFNFGGRTKWQRHEARQL